MSDNHLKNVVEAALLAAGRPLAVSELAELFDEADRPSGAMLRDAIAGLAADYEGRGLEILETASGVRIQVRKEFSGEVARLWPERPQRYSRALLETLALIAYRQPITRAEIESVRGVAVNPNILKTLMERNWVRVVGQRDVPGRPELLGTTREFLDYFGLKAIDDLPPLAELKALADLNPQLPLPGTNREGFDDDAVLVEDRSVAPRPSELDAPGVDSAAMDDDAADLDAGEREAMDDGAAATAGLVAAPPSDFQE
jgi:segregation and condensation protein B